MFLVKFEFSEFAEWRWRQQESAQPFLSWTMLLKLLHRCWALLLCLLAVFYPNPCPEPLCCFQGFCPPAYCVEECCFMAYVCSLSLFCPRSTPQSKSKASPLPSLPSHQGWPWDPFLSQRGSGSPWDRQFFLFALPYSFCLGLHTEPKSVVAILTPQG